MLSSRKQELSASYSITKAAKPRDLTSKLTAPIIGYAEAAYMQT